MVVGEVPHGEWFFSEGKFSTEANSCHFKSPLKALDFAYLITTERYCFQFFCPSQELELSEMSHLHRGSHWLIRTK